MAAMLYSIFAYAVGVGALVHLILFSGNLLLPRTLDAAATVSPLEATLVDLALLLLFALQHSIMARKGFKAWWTKFVPEAAERATYVLAAGVFVFALSFFWQPIDGALWAVQGGAATALQAVSWLGWGVLLLATFLINHFELFGLRQPYAALTGRAIPAPEFRTPLLYKHVRHPIYLGIVLAVWATPVMTWGHLLFAGGCTAYILVGIWFEERDLVALFGERYRAYRRQVPMLIPSFARDPDAAPAAKKG